MGTTGFEGFGRSNYVRITDLQAFREAAWRLNCTTAADSKGRLSLIGNDGGIRFYDPDIDEDLDPVAILAPLLVEGEVMILSGISIGEYTKMVMDSEGRFGFFDSPDRYPAGWAMAFDSSGTVVEIDLEDIHRLAAERFPDSGIITKGTD